MVDIYTESLEDLCYFLLQMTEVHNFIPCSFLSEYYSIIQLVWLHLPQALPILSKIQAVKKVHF